MRGVAAMAIVRWLLVAGSAVAAAGSIASYINARRQWVSAPTTARQYVCPMHPGIMLDHPGECPICNMELVVKPDPRTSLAAKSDEVSTGPSMGDLTLERLRSLGMRTSTVVREMMDPELRAGGVVDADDHNLAEIRAEVPGRVDELLVSGMTALVHRGQVLATIDSLDVLRSERGPLAAHGSNRSRVAAWETRTAAAPSLNHSGMSRSEIAELQTGKTEQRRTLQSPIDGYLIANRASRGLMFAPDSVLFEVADLRNVWVSLNVSEIDVALVHVGQRARVDLPAFPHEVYTGTVQLISPVARSPNRTLSVRVEVKNSIGESGPHLRPGMYDGLSRHDPESRTDRPGGSGRGHRRRALPVRGERERPFLATSRQHRLPHDGQG